MKAFTQMTDDINPLHIDDDYAKRKGFDGRVVYGMLTSSFYSTLVGMYLPGKYSLLHSIDISYHCPVYIGDELTVYGEVSYKNEAYSQIEITAYITNHKNKKISKSKIKVGITSSLRSESNEKA